MKRQKIFQDNRHSFYHTCVPTIVPSQSYRGNLMGHSHSIIQDYNKDRYYTTGHRGYNNQRDYFGRNEPYMHSDYVHTHNNNLAMRKPAISRHHYYKSLNKPDYYKPSITHHYSEPSLSDIASYHESEVSYGGSLVSVASSFDDLQDTIQTHKAEQQPHHGHVYSHSDTEGRRSRHIYSFYSSDDQKKRHSDAERDIHQRKDLGLQRRHMDEMFSEARTKNNKTNTNDNQPMSHSIYNTSMNANGSGNNKVPLMMFRKDESEGSSNSDVVYIPVVILPEKRSKSTSNESNAEVETVDNEQSFTKRKFLIQHNFAKDTIMENDETLSDIPDPYTNVVYRKVNDKNMFKENECPLLNNTAGMKRIQDMNAFDEKLFQMIPTVNSNMKNLDDERVKNKLFSHFSGTEIEKLQGIITYSDNEKIPKNNPINIMVAGLSTVTNPFSNPTENLKTKLMSSGSRYSGTSWKKNIVQHSQSVQVSQKSVPSKKDGEVQVSDLRTITTKDGDVQTSEASFPVVNEANSVKLKGEKPGVISDDTILSTPVSIDHQEVKVKEHNSAKVNSGSTVKGKKSGSESKYKEIIHEINDLVKKISEEENEPKRKSSEEYNCCQHRVCRKENNSSRQTKNKLKNEKNQPIAKNKLKKTDCKEMPKNFPYFQQDSYESPFQRLFSNDYKMTSRPPYFPIGMYTDNPMNMENTYKWLTEPNRGFSESASSHFRTFPKKFKNVHTAYPFFTKLKKKILSKDTLSENTDTKETIKKEDDIKEEDEEESEIQQQYLAEEVKISQVKTIVESDKKTEKKVESKPKQQIEVNLSLLWDYVIQGFNLYLGKTVHTVLLDGIYTLGTVTEKLQNRLN